MVPGLLLAGAIGLIGLLAARTQWAQHAGLSALTLAIIGGILAGNTLFPAIATRCAAGVDLSKSTLLRAGIILYGFRITFQQIAAVGWTGVLIAALMVTLTYLIAVQIGTRLLGLDRQTSMLIGAGSAICGAAAVIAVEPVVGGQAHKVCVAVATVVIFGTLGMFLYPLLYPHLGLSAQQYGIFAGSTIHEVAQVVVAGNSISEGAASTAVIEKMLRVMMLAPFLLVLSATRPRSDEHGQRNRKITIPWFALLFIAVSALHSLQWVPPNIVSVLIQIDTVLLAMAMAALGLRTHIGAVRQAGLKPIALAGMLFVFLVVGGYGVNRLATQLLS
ncbi:MAG: YeiH family protein [Steroidobacteraceae bacterium]